jgi:hypothetical protein
VLTCIAGDQFQARGGVDIQTERGRLTFGTVYPYRIDKMDMLFDCLLSLTSVL